MSDDEELYRLGIDFLNATKRKIDSTHGSSNALEVFGAATGLLWETLTEDGETTVSEAQIPEGASGGSEQVQESGEAGGYQEGEEGASNATTGTPEGDSPEERGSTQDQKA